MWIEWIIRKAYDTTEVICFLPVDSRVMTCEHLVETDRVSVSIVSFFHGFCNRFMKIIFMIKTRLKDYCSRREKRQPQ